MRSARLALPLLALLPCLASPADGQLLSRDRTTTPVLSSRPPRLLIPERTTWLCHLLNGGLQAELVSVPDSTVAAHLAHGDFAPEGGTCVVPRVPCNGIGALPCPGGSSCWDLPWLPCGPGIYDCPGYCGKVVPLRCSPSGDCPAGTECFDDPDDDCDPDCGDVGCPTACAAVMPLTCSGTPSGCAGGTCADVMGDGAAAPCDTAWVGQCVFVRGQPCGGHTGLECDAGATCAMDDAEPPWYAGQCVRALRP